MDRSTSHISGIHCGDIHSVELGLLLERSNSVFQSFEVAVSSGVSRFSPREVRPYFLKKISFGRDIMDSTGRELSTAIG